MFSEVSITNGDKDLRKREMPFIINENEHGNAKRLVNCLNDKVP